MGFWHVLFLCLHIKSQRPFSCRTMLFCLHLREMDHGAHIGEQNMKSDEIANCVDAYMQASGIFVVFWLLIRRLWVRVPPGMPETCVDTEFRPVPRTHAASRKGPLDGADPPSFSARVVDPAQSSRDVPVNLTLQLTRRESLSVIKGGTCWCC